MRKDSKQTTYTHTKYKRRETEKNEQRGITKSAKNNQ